MKKTLSACIILMLSSEMPNVFADEIDTIELRGAACEEYKTMHVLQLYSGSSSDGETYPLAASFRREDGTKTGLIQVYRGKASNEHKNIFSMLLTAKTLNLPVMMSCYKGSLIDTIYLL